MPKEYNILMRTDPTQLPQTGELHEIAAKEGKREPIRDGHFVTFEVINEWLDRCNVITDLFNTEFLSLEEFSDAEVSKIKEEVVDFTLKNHSDPKFLELLNKVTSYLGEQDPLQKADIIFVYGSPYDFRIEKAVELYLRGLAPCIMVTGKGPHYGTNQITEAERTKNRAIELGVPDSAIIVEPDSITIADNIKRGLNKLNELNLSYNRILQVIAWYAQRRAFGSMLKYTRPEVQITRVNCKFVAKGLQENSWFSNQRGAEIVFNEFVKMKISTILNST
jgi:hypothetical protein